MRQGERDEARKNEAANPSESWKKNMEAMREHPDVFDFHQALSSVGDDLAFLTETVGLMQAAWPSLLAEIRSGVEGEDLGQVVTSARLAMAAALNVSAKRTYESALQLERVARRGDLLAAQTSQLNLEREVDLLRSFLATLGSNECSSS